MASKKSFLSAVVIVPPKNLWSQIQDIRRQHDKAFSTWMPHVNLLFPFVYDDPQGDNFNEAVSRITSNFPPELKKFKLKLTCGSIKCFYQGQNSTVHVRPVVAETSQGSKVHSQPTAVTETVKSAKVPQMSQRNKNNQQGNNTSATETKLKEVTQSDNLVEMQVPCGHTFSFVELLYVPPVPDAYRDLPVASLSTLAIVDSGKHNGPDPIENIETKKSAPNNKKLSYDYANQSASTLETNYPVKSIIEAGDWPVIGGDISEETDNAEPFTLVTSKTRCAVKKGGPDTHTVPNKVTQNTKDTEAVLNSLQDYLQKLFPQATNDRKGPYVPHLTLGQCKSKDVDSFVSELKRGWKDLEFEVDKIYLISRPSSIEPHEIRRTIMLPN